MDLDTREFTGVLKHSSKCPGFFAAVTVVGVAEESPEEVFARFCHPLGHPSVFSSVKVGPPAREGAIFLTTRCDPAVV
jgi:hypothetical protein